MIKTREYICETQRGLDERKIEKPLIQFAYIGRVASQQLRVHSENFSIRQNYQKLVFDNVFHLTFARIFQLQLQYSDEQFHFISWLLTNLLVPAFLSTLFVQHYCNNNLDHK